MGVFSIWLTAPRIAQQVKPGQFLNVRVSRGPDPLLRRPISVCDVDVDQVRLVFRVVGRGTELLSRTRPGDSLDVLGPLGRPAPHPHGQGVLICGGGVGAAPLLMLARTLAPTNRLRILLGARTKSELLLVKEFRALKAKVAVATDDGSAGYNGTVTELAAYEVSGRQPTADSRQQLVAFACGPRPMLADLVSRLDPIPVWGFIEERMGCGTGICYCCALPRRDGGVARFCEDGPVVRLDGVVL